MKKVLIYKSKSDLKPVGGPDGYLYNLYSGLEKIGKKDIKVDFLPEKNSNSFIDKIIKKLKKNKKLLFWLYINYLTFNRGKSSSVDFNKYDIVHFHSTIDYYVCRNKLKDYNGKIIITSHSPKPCHQELVDYLQLDSQKKHDRYIKKVEKIDIFAFNNATYIHFPCKEAEECYLNTWKMYEKIRKNNRKKYVYLTTGLIPIEILKTKKELREEYNIPQDKFVVCYVGRHNEVKGYGSLKRLGQKEINKNKNLYFVIAGAEEPLKGLKNKNWREIGWTNKPHDYIKLADVFVLPNKETYFDLILLEVLSIGTPVILTETGGNKYFKKFKDSGLFFYEYDNYEEFDKVLNKVLKADNSSLVTKNQKVFIENFSSEIFAKKYVELYKKL